MSVEGVVGLQRGDEGKGRFVDMMMEDFDIGVRFNGGNNAGHTVVSANGDEYKTHSLPSSILHDHTMSVIGNGTVIDSSRLRVEMETLRDQGIDIGTHNLLISGGAHLTLPSYILQDVKREKGARAQGSTKTGISSAYSAKASREGVRTEIINNDPDKLLGIVAGKGSKQDRETAQQFVDDSILLGPFVTDTALYLNRALRKEVPARILAEAAQAFLLDLDHGMYPFTTSSSTTAGGISSGLGIPASFITHITGVAKAVPSHVGGGPFVTEITDPDKLERLHGDMTKVDAEKGTTTNRIRRLGHLDLAQIRRSQMINGRASEQVMALTKLDWVPRYGEEVQICIGY